MLRERKVGNSGVPAAYTPFRFPVPNEIDLLDLHTHSYVSTGGVLHSVPHLNLLVSRDLQAYSATRLLSFASRLGGMG